MTEKLVVEIDLPPTVHLPADLREDKRGLQDALVVLLYKQGRLTMMQAREIMGITRREFEERLPEFGVAMVDIEDLPHELDGSEKLAKLR